MVDWFCHGRAALAVIVYVLLEKDAKAPVSAEDIVAACALSVEVEQDTILQTLFARWQPFYLPEEGMIRLLSAELPWYLSDERPGRAMPWQKALDESRIEKVTTNMFAGATCVDMLTKSLDYDQSFVVGADTIDLIGLRSREFSSESVLDCVRELSDRCPDLLPTEPNVLRVLNVASSYDASHILNLLFKRNPALMVTEQMLKICRNPLSFQSLLSLEKTGAQHGDVM
ncbi:hypothetical protein MBLNU13_g11395t1 [Cladosporium sp. NU13]